MKIKYKAGQRIIYKSKVRTVRYELGGTLYLARRGNKIIAVSATECKPLGYLLIKPTRNGQFRYSSVSWNNEKLQTSEPLADKGHVIKMAKFYFPDFVIVDKTK